ncbi:triterpenes biosynthesis [Minicystis rosea]|nr:triterpenes biosynthesis [Minicystis rosea]
MILFSTPSARTFLLAAAAFAASTAGCTSPAGEGPRDDWQARAAGYLDERSASWLASPPPISNVACAMSCHTTFPYVMARSSLAPFAKTPAADDARARFEARVADATAGTAIPFYGNDDNDKGKQSHATEAVLNAAALALDDIGSGKPLGASTTSALDRMWAEQRADGTWDWLEFGLEPWETRNDLGAALAALVTGSIPANTTSAQAAGTTKLVGYIQKRVDGMVLHDQAMVLWASGKLTGLLDPARADAIAADLAATQLEDGGFSLGAWGQGSLAEDRATESDGYATAIAVLALCSGTAQGANRSDVQKGLSWLTHHQADDGSWPGRSVNGDSAQVEGFMTDAATAYASLALTTCVPDQTASR